MTQLLGKTPGKYYDALIQVIPTIAMRLTTKSQVTIPLAVRRKLGLGPGSEVEISALGKVAVLQPRKNAKPAAHAALPEWLRKMSGAGSGRYKTEELMRLTRGED